MLPQFAGLLPALGTASLGWLVLKVCLCPDCSKIFDLFVDDFSFLPPFTGRFFDG